MLLRLLLFFMLIAAVARMFGRMLSMLWLPPQRAQSQKKRPPDLDKSQIQDADFKDL